jgi:hypothetical protein
MRIDQRNAGAAVTPSSGAQTFTLDRWSFYPTQAAKLTTQQNQGSVTPPPGFTNYIGVTSSSSYSVVSSDFFILYQWIEGFNTADLDFGKSTAKTVTLSFWVRSSLTGTFGGSLINSAQNRCYPFTYSISSANTWTQISIRIPGDTTGTWIGATNGQGMAVIFSLGAGSTYSGTANAWSATSQLYSATGAVSVVGTNAATWYVTGVQLEEGSVPTAFEYRQYTTELQLCQRYFNSMGGNHDYEHFATVSQTSSTDARGMVFLPVSMRTIPTIGQSGSFSVNGGTSSITGTFSAGTTMYFNIAGNFGGVQNLGFDFWTGTAGNYNQNAASMWIVRANASQATRLTFSAEL